jgi:hypothetical protein
MKVFFIKRKTQPDSYSPALFRHVSCVSSPRQNRSELAAACSEHPPKDVFKSASDRTGLRKIKLIEELKIV